MRDLTATIAVMLSAIGALVSTVVAVYALRTGRRVERALRAKEGTLPESAAVEEYGRGGESDEDAEGGSER